MDFDLSQDQKDIKRTAHDLLASRSAFPKVREAAESRTYDAALTAELAELGWPGIAVSEDHGGQGLGVVELAILLEELGYAMTASPLLGSAGAALIIEQGASDAQKAAWLAKLASGEATGGFGAPGLVLDGDRADVIVLVDPDGGARLVAAGDADVEVIEAIDPTRGYAKVSADGEALSGDVSAGLDRAMIAVSAELTGIAQRSLDMTLEYARGRLPGRRPPVCADAAAHRERAVGDVLRGVDRRRGARPPGGGRGTGEGRRVGGRPRGHGVGHPGPRRHRLHVGGRRALALQAGADGRVRARRRGHAPRQARAPRRRPAGAHRGLTALRRFFGGAQETTWAPPQPSGRR